MKNWMQVEMNQGALLVVIAVPYNSNFITQLIYKTTKILQEMKFYGLSDSYATH